MNTPKRTGLKGVVATVTLFILLQIITTSGQNGVQLMFLGNALANHGFVIRGQIGDNPDDSDAVRVETDNTDCCTAGDGLSTGNWFYPNETAVPPSSTGYDFFFNRRTQRVTFSRRRGGALGIYLCSGVPDAGGTIRDRYVGIYTTNSGRPVITSITFHLLTELNAVTPRFTLTCISVAGPVEQNAWFRDGNELQDGSPYDIAEPAVVNRVSAEYHHSLIVTGRFPDTYTCRVLSTRPAEATPSGVFTDMRDIDIVAANPPTIVSVRGVRGARVRWTIPTGGATVMSYRIYYQQVGGSDNGFRDVEDGSATEATLTVQVGLTYTINMVALSEHLPSALSNSMTVVIVIVATPVITMVRPTSSTSITVVWTQDDEEEDVDSFEIAFARVTGAMQLGPCPSAEDSDTVTVSDGTARQQTVMELEEFSTYSFTVTAISSDGRSFPSDSMTDTTEQAAPSGPPESVRTVAVTSTSITVAWNPVNCIDRNSEISQYTISFGPKSMPDDRDTMTVPGSVDTGGMETISPLIPFTNYSIEVAAVNSGGQTGEFSDAIVVATEQDVPSEVRGLQATTDLTSIAVSWTEPETLNGILTAYEVCYQQQGEEGRELRNITNTSITSTVLSGLIPGTTYTISVRARTIAGPGEEVSIDRTTTSIPRVVNLVATPGIVSIAVSWSTFGGSFEDITAYEVCYQQQGEEERELMNITDTSMTSTVLTGLIPNTTYTISVRACTIAGPGEEDSVMATTLIIPDVQNVELMSISDTAVLVFWDSIEGVSYYRVYYSPTGSSSERQDQTDNEGTVDTIMPSAFISNLMTGVEYQFQVVAVVEVDGETLSGERSQLDDSSRVVVGTPGEEQSSECSCTAAGLAGSVVASAILTALLYTVILVLVVVVVLKRRQSTGAVKQKPGYSTEIPLNECPAYGKFSAATPASVTDEERVYEQPQ